MPSPANAQVSVDIAEIKATLQNLPEIKAALEALGRSIAALREEYLVEHSKLVASTQRAHERIDALSKELEVVERSLAEVMKLLPLMRAISYLVAGISVPLTLALMLWLWQMITHGGLALP